MSVWAFVKKRNFKLLLKKTVLFSIDWLIRVSGRVNYLGHWSRKCSACFSQEVAMIFFPTGFLFSRNFTWHYLKHLNL